MKSLNRIVSIVILCWNFSACAILKSEIEHKIQLNPGFILEPGNKQNTYNLYYLNNYIEADSSLNEAERRIWLQVQPNVTDVYFNDSLVVVSNIEIARPKYYVFYLGKASENFKYLKAKDKKQLSKKLNKIGILYKIELGPISKL